MQFHGLIEQFSSLFLSWERDSLGWGLSRGLRARSISETLTENCLAAIKTKVFCFSFFIFLALLSSSNNAEKYRIAKKKWSEERFRFSMRKCFHVCRRFTLSLEANDRLGFGLQNPTLAWPWDELRPASAAEREWEAKKRCKISKLVASEVDVEWNQKGAQSSP